MKKLILSLLSNRVRRNYTGGAQIDFFEGKSSGTDCKMPEDWLASTIPAVNPGMPNVPNEGLAKVTAENGEKIILKELFEKYSEHYLGKKHFGKLGSELGFLAKLLDSSMRLHTQVHPSAEFAQKHFNSRWGKLETYVILGARNSEESYLRLGFQRLKDKQQWKKIVLEQDIAAMDDCFDKVPVKPGEIWVVPGAVPHAIGEGLFVLEVMEPTDFVFRCEFQREGIIVPEQARFSDGGPELVFEMFDYSVVSKEQIREKYCIAPTVLKETNCFKKEQLIGSEQTDCFDVFRYEVSGDGVVEKDDSIWLCIIANGCGTIQAGDEKLNVRRGDRFVVASEASAIEYKADKGMTILVCRPSQVPDNF